MNASIVKRSVVILGAIAVPWVGCALWSAHRERAAKDALAAEIRAAMAAEPAESDRRAGRLDLTAEYAAVLEGLVSGAPVTSDAFHQATNSEAPWDAVPPAVTAALQAHAGSLDLLDALVMEQPPGRFDMGKDWNPWNRAQNLLFARGRVQIAARDWDGLLRTVRVYCRVADDFLASSCPGNPFLPFVYASVWESQLLRLMEEAAVHPDLPEAAAAACLALVSANGGRERAGHLIEAYFWRESEQVLLELLGDDPDEVLRKHNLVEDDSLSERAARLFGRERRRGRVSFTPSAAILREMWEVSGRVRDIHARRDGSALLARGDLEHQVRRDLGGGWSAGLLAGVQPGRAGYRWREDARNPVLRAAFAVRIHEARTGRPPATLAELVPSILDAVPADAWTGKPVHYAPKPGGGWILEAGPPVEGTAGADASSNTGPYRVEKK